LGGEGEGRRDSSTRFSLKLSEAVTGASKKRHKEKTVSLNSAGDPIIKTEWERREGRKRTGREGFKTEKGDQVWPIAGRYTQSPGNESAEGKIWIKKER